MLESDPFLFSRLRKARLTMAFQVCLGFVVMLVVSSVISILTTEQDEKSAMIQVKKMVQSVNQRKQMNVSETV